MTIAVLDQRRKELDLSNKRLALELSERIAKRGGKALAVDTIEPHVSRLFSRNREGISFMRRFAPELALVLELPEDAVRGSLERPILLLDPQLPAEATTFISERQSALGTFEVIRVTDLAESASAAPSLRDAAKRATAAIVVLATPSDRAFYEGADLTYALLEKTARGVRLSTHPELIPDPPLKPARRREYGTILVPDAELAAEAHRGLASQPRDTARAWDKGWWDRVRSAERAGEEPSFPIELVLPKLRERVGDPKLDVAHERLSNVTLDDIRGRSPTRLWVEEGSARVLVTGQAAEAVVEALGDPEMRLVSARVKASIEGLEQRNPFPDELASQLALELEALKTEGLNVEGLLSCRRRELEGRDVVRVLAASESAELDARATLLRVAQREWMTEVAPLRLRAAARADLLLMAPRGAGKELHLHANMGAGRLLWIRILSFQEQPTPFTVAKSPERNEWRYDGGDTHIFMKPDYDEMLEGERLVPRERRREREDD